MRSIRILLTIFLLAPLPVFAQPLGEVCDVPPLPLQPRLDNRTFPSVFSAWGGLGWSSVVNQPHLSDLEQMGQHDLYWCCLMWNHDFYQNGDTLEVREVVPHRGQGTSTSYRDAYIEQNPNMVFLAGIDMA